MSDDEAAADEGSWARLFAREHAATTTVLAGGVALYATDVYVTTSLLPSAVAEIGGQRLYAWSTTLFLLTSVVASVLVSRVLAATGGRRAYLLALGLFLAGTVTDALAPSMEVLLAGLGYALLRASLPAALWTRGSALVSAMWGVGTLAGPSLGGVFAQLGAWRGAFVTMAVATAALAALVPVALRGDDPPAGREPLPVASLLLVGGATAAIGLAGGTATPAAAGVGVAVGVALLVGFVLHERRTASGLLPAAVFAPGASLRWVYATIAVLAAGLSPEIFVPLFAQELAGVAPLAAGFLGAALAAGWTLAEIPSAVAARPATVRALAVAGPAVLTAGLALTALAPPDASSGVAGWVLTLLLAGCGVGLAWPHLAALAMGAAGEPGEGDKVSATISTVQLMGNAVGAAVAGLLVNLGASSTRADAVLLFGGFAVLTLLAVATAALAVRSRPDGAEPPAADQEAGSAGGRRG